MTSGERPLPEVDLTGDERERYHAVTDEVFASYAEGRHAEALERVRQAMPALPSWRADLSHQAACLLAASGHPREALDELRAAFGEGAWWHRRILVDDDDLAPLRDLDGYADLVERSHARALEAADTTRSPLVARPPGTPVGLLVTLHGAGDDASGAARQWQAAVDAGFVLVAVESSQRSTPRYRSWPDPALAARDLDAAVAGLPATDRALPLVTAGFSAGGRQAILWALAGRPGAPVAFVTVAPAVWPDQVDDRHLADAVRRDVTGVILLGAADDDVGEGALAMHARIRQAGLACRLDHVAGLGHGYPADFDLWLVRTLGALSGTGSGHGAATARQDR